MLSRVKIKPLSSMIIIVLGTGSKTENPKWPYILRHRCFCILGVLSDNFGTSDRKSVKKQFNIIMHVCES